MKAHGASGAVWAPENLDVYLEAPRSVVKGAKMAFPGLKKAEDGAVAVAYLERLSKQPEESPAEVLSSRIAGPSTACDRL